jgi:hypothetical protein
MHVTVDVVSLAEVRRNGFKHISAEGMFLEPGETVVMNADGFPVVISTTGVEMMVAHANQADVVDTIINVFRSHGVFPLSIRMSMQMYAPGLESAFLDRAMRAGLRHVWAASPIAEFLVRVGADVGGQNFVAIRRDN